MSSHEQDQIEAAASHLQKMIHAEGLAETEGEMPAWLDAMFTRCVEQATGVCDHVQNTFAQPMFVNAHEGFWRCQDCLGTAIIAAQVRAFVLLMEGLVDPREHCCDICGVVDLQRQWEIRMLLVGPVLMSFAVCGPCEEMIDSEVHFHTITKPTKEEER